MKLLEREREREREMYRFQLIGGPTFEEWPITIFLVKESKILGRDKDRVLVSNLLGEDTGSNVPSSKWAWAVLVKQPWPKLPTIILVCMPILEKEFGFLNLLIGVGLPTQSLKLLMVITQHYWISKSNGKNFVNWW